MHLLLDGKTPTKFPSKTEISLGAEAVHLESSWILTIYPLASRQRLFKGGIRANHSAPEIGLCYLYHHTCFTTQHEN